MGTRGAWGLIVDGQEKITYNHFDSYPSGLGEDILKVVRERIAQKGLGGFRDDAVALKVVNPESTPTPEERALYRKFANTSVSSQNLDEWYVLLRELQGEVEATLDAGVMLDGADFPQDSLFCEWAYMIDLDANTFEVYEGFQTEPHEDGRFASRLFEKDSRFGGGQYYPVRLVRAYDLDNLPENFAKLDEELHPEYYEDDD